MGPSGIANAISHGFDLSSLSAEQQHLLFAAQSQLANGHHPSTQLPTNVAAASHQMNLLSGADALPGRGNVASADPLVLESPQANQSRTPGQDLEDDNHEEETYDEDDDSDEDGDQDEGEYSSQEDSDSNGEQAADRAAAKVRDGAKIPAEKSNGENTQQDSDMMTKAQ